MIESSQDAKDAECEKSRFKQDETLPTNLEVHTEPKKGFKRFNITVLVGTYETHSMWIPKDTTLEDAVKWANENSDQIPHGGDEIVSVDDDNCDFED